MPHYTFRGINAAFQGLVEEITESPSSSKPMLRGMFSRTPSRNGEVIRWRRPVIIEYTNPLERVLFNQARDANCFFHLYESMWMLAGRNDLAPLQYYVSDFGNYSDDGETLNGAYGHRWRHAPTRPKGTVSGFSNDFEREVHYHHEDAGEVDQLKILIDHLKHDPNSRRAVLQMWNVEDDLLKIGQQCELCSDDPAYRPVCKSCNGTGTINQSKDTCCNLSVVFEIENVIVDLPDPARGRTTGEWNKLEPRLNMTVYNRSNDLVWGALGANVCHFSVLMEYVAACIGVEVGTYCQVSSNMHIYTDPKKWQPEKWLADGTWDYYKHTSAEVMKVVDGQWKGDEIQPFPLVKDPATFDNEVVEFVERHGKDSLAGSYTEPFLRDVAQPMMIAFHHHKNRKYADAMMTIETVKADDWRIAGKSWLLKRKRLWENKHAN